MMNETGDFFVGADGNPPAIFIFRRLLYKIVVAIVSVATTKRNLFVREFIQVPQI